MAEREHMNRRMPNCLEHCSESHPGICKQCGRTTQVGLLLNDDTEGERCLRCISGDPNAPDNEPWAAHEENCPHYLQDDEITRYRTRGATLRLEDGTEFELSNAQLGTICAGLMLAIGSAHLESPQKINRGFNAAKVMHERMGTEQCRDLIRKFKVVLDAAFPELPEHEEMVARPGSIIDLLQKALGPDVQVLSFGLDGLPNPKRPLS